MDTGKWIFESPATGRVECSVAADVDAMSARGIAGTPTWVTLPDGRKIGAVIRDMNDRPFCPAHYNAS